MIYEKKKNMIGNCSEFILFGCILKKKTNNNNKNIILASICIRLSNIIFNVFQL